MTDKGKRSLSSFFRLPKIPVKNLFIQENKGFISYSITKQGKSWEVKDSVGCQLFWIELETENGTGNAAEMVGIFGEQLAILRRSGSMENTFKLSFIDTPEIVSITIDCGSDMTNIKKVRFETVTKDASEKETVRNYAWEATSASTWNLSLKGESKIQGGFIKHNDTSATINFPLELAAEEIAIFSFAISFATCSKF
ncbi:hypothetical protein K502DRAFT_343260 [Neoconidiobolus thromboides FSU 785]|nr:hypothetical protein K502DRAFT_343260 [Neoconidiobolus thromboides FSU 785]